MIGLNTLYKGKKDCFNSKPIDLFSCAVFILTYVKKMNVSA